MKDILIQYAAEVVFTVLMLAITAGFTWITAKIGKREELKNVNAAKAEFEKATLQTVGELQQTMVSDLKAKAVDGKLSRDEIEDLGNKLYEITMKKMSNPAIKLLEAAGVDLVAWIRGAGEDWINSLHSGTTFQLESIEIPE